MTVVTRFAPSPTGDLHIGGARTALFNKLYAQHTGGKYLVRIEDTDQARNTPEAMNGIHSALEWLDLVGDEDVVYQSSRQERHIAVAHQLLLRGAAYRDYTTPAQIATVKSAFEATGQKGPFRYQSLWRDKPHERGTGPYTVRLKAPRSGSITINDLVQGEVTVQCKELDDTVLLRSDGTPTYMLAVVVDDHDMGVTHVIRGDDHLNNAFRQIPIYDALDWERPTYAHIPLVFNERGEKLSKRNGAAGVFEYQAMGIQPAAMLNYLAKLGWGHGDDEIFTMQEAADWFDIKDVGRAPARIDMKKLRSISQHYIKEANPADLLVELLTRLDANGVKFEPWVPKNLLKLIPVLQPRSANLNELYENASFMWATRPIQLDEKAQAKIDDEIISGIYDLLDDYGTDSNLHDLMVQYAEQTGIKLGDVAMSLRAALTGKTVSPPVDAVMYALGSAETLRRLKDRF